MVHCLFLARKPKQNEHACYLLYWTPDQALYLCRIGTNTTALEQLSGRRPATSVHRYRFILHTWSSLTTLRGLVRSQSCLVRRNWAKKKECSTGTTANKDRNYIDNCSSPSPSLRRTVWRLERKTTSPSRRWCQ
uniref:Orf42 n=1 Tax=Daucus carota subsp. sativus TaxID=79200 RepID=I1TIF0_DAUCS|nr:orf42 [Daucus carota subsp. sativus]AEY81180.1 orf42 [Daucus carota subsp. sativus]